MSDANIDSLYLNVESDSTKASKALDNLVNKLLSLNIQLGRMNIASLNGMSNGLLKFARASESLKNIKTADFTRLIKNINSLSNIDRASLNRTASNLNIIAKSVSNLSSVSATSSGITDLVKNISKLGGANVQRAIVQIPLLAKALRDMMAQLSKAPTVNKNIIQMTNALANLAMRGNRVGAAAKSMTSGLDRFNISTQLSRRRTFSLASAIGKLYVKFWLLIRAVKWAGEGIKSAMDYIEDYNYYNVTFGKVAAEWSDTFANYGYENAESYANSFEARLNSLNEKMSGVKLNENGLLVSTGFGNLGLDISALTSYEANIGAVTNSLGLTGEASVATSKALTMLAGDMSSLKNIDLDTVMTNFSSGIIGQSRALYKYGIDITNATLQQYAYKYGIEKTITEMTQSEKMQLRLLAILDQSKVAWGDLANTINSPSNQLRIFQNNIVALGRSIGGLFMPIVSKVLPYINAMVIALRRLVEWIAVLFGVEIDFDQFGTGYDSSGAFEDVSDSLDDVADSYDKASKSAKKYENTVLSIDQLHKLNGENDTTGGSTSSGTGSTIDLTNEINDALANYESIWNKAFDQMTNKANELADNIVELFGSKKFYEIGNIISTNISESLNRINWENVYSSAEMFGEGFADFLNGLLTPEVFYSVARTISNSLNTAIKAVFAFGDTFDWQQLGESIASAINGVFENFDFIKFAETLNTWVDGIKTTIKTAIKNIKWSEIIKDATNFVLSLDFDTAVVLTLFSLRFQIAGLAGKLFGASAKGIASAVQGLLFKKLGVDSWTAAMKMIGTSLMSSIGVAAIPITILLALTVGGTIFAWKYQNNEEFQKQVDDAISNSPLRYVEANLDYGARIEEKYSMKDALQKQADRKQKRSDWWSGLQEQFDGNVLTIKTQFKDTAKTLKKKWDKITKNVTKTPLTISTALESLKGKLKDLLDDAGNFFKGKKLVLSAAVENIKSKVMEKWNDAKDWWSGKPALSAISTVVSSIKERLQSAWLSAREWWDSKPSLTNISTTVSSIKDKLSSAWTNARTWWGDKPALSVIKASVTNLATLLSDAWSSAQKWAKDHFKLNVHIEWDYNITKLSKKIGNFLFGKEALPKIRLFESGGIPEMGELFIAREKGPEMVGRMGSRPAVANNDQIAAGIAAAVQPAVYNAMMMAMASSHGSDGKVVEIPIYLDGNEIGRASLDYQKMINKRYSLTPSIV